MANLFELVGEIAVRGAQAATGAITKVDQRAEKLATRIDEAGQRMQGFGNGMSNVGDKATALSGAVAATGAGLGALVNNVTQTADRLGVLSERLGVSTEFLQTWRRVASDLKIDNEALTDGLKELSLRADEFAQTGKGPAAEVFERLGFTQDQVDAMKGNTEEMFRSVLDSIRGVQNQAARQRIADELFGGQAGEQFTNLLNKSQEEVDKLVESAQETGGFFSSEDIDNARDFNRQIRDLGERAFAALQQAVVRILPTLQQLMPLVESQLIPAMERAASTIAGLVQWFSQLPPSVQQTALVATTLAVALGPILSIVGRLISVFGGVLRVLARAPAVIGAVSAVFTALTTGALAPLLPVIAAIVAAAAGLWAAWEFGPRVLRAVGDAWNWLTGIISSVANTITSTTLNGLRSLWNGAKSILDSIVDGFANAWQMVYDATVGRVMDMVSTVTDAVRDMWNELTGNSIIPRLADEAINEFDRMAEGGEDSGERMRRGMTDGMRSLAGPNGDAGIGGGRSAAGGGTYIDMSHSVIRDDRDMLDRLRRSGADVSGAF